MNSVCEPSAAGAINRVAGLVRALVDLKALTAVLKHLRHERQPLQAAILVKRAEDLLFASNLHPITRSEFHGSSLPSCAFSVFEVECRSCLGEITFFPRVAKCQVTYQRNPKDGWNG
jgi:hypothetical protein